jgi:ammonia channel protein AmtB
MEWFFVPWLAFAALGFVLGVLAGLVAEDAGAALVFGLGGAVVGLVKGFIPAAIIFALHIAYMLVIT